jgi:hypothetical protein
MINILYGTGSPGVVTVGIYDTLSDTSFEVSGVTTTFISGITTVGLGTTSNPPYNAQMSFELTSNTNLRISY